MVSDEKKKRLRDLMHAIQTGVAYDQANGSNDGSPKHLRVGVNASMVEHSALAELLIVKGIITEDEYTDALIRGMEAEVLSYENRLKQCYGINVKLA